MLLTVLRTFHGKHFFIVLQLLGILNFFRSETKVVNIKFPNLKVVLCHLV